MIVKELIKMLSELDQEKEIKYADDLYGDQDIDGIAVVGSSKEEYYLIN